MPKVIAFNCSAGKDGNTAILLKAACVVVLLGGLLQGCAGRRAGGPAPAGGDRGR